jgi:hypothetical protein
VAHLNVQIGARCFQTGVRIHGVIGLTEVYVAPVRGQCAARMERHLTVVLLMRIYAPAARALVEKNPADVNLSGGQSRAVFLTLLPLPRFARERLCTTP